MREHPDYAEDFHFTLDSEETKAALRRAAWVNLALLLALAGLVSAFCAHLGGGAPAAGLGAVLIAINPRLGYYVPTLWPELLHAVLLTAALLSLSQAVDHSRRGGGIGYGLAVGAGLLAGYATLTKGVAESFFSLVCIAVAGWSLWRLRSDRKSAARLMIVLALFAVSAQAVVLPQRLANNARIGTPVIATNFWLNVEVGVGFGDLDAHSVRSTYFGASRDFLEREELSRARVRSYLAGVDPARLALRLASKLERAVSSSFLARNRATKRWQAIDEEDLGTARRISPFLNWGLLAGAVAYALLAFRWRFPELLLLGFVGYYFAGLVVVVGSERMFVQAIAPLSILTASLVRLLPDGQGARSTPSMGSSEGG